PWRTALARVALAGALALGVSGWWFARNYVLYEGDWLGVRAAARAAEERALPHLRPSRFRTVRDQGVPMLQMLRESNWIPQTFQSFWAVFGYHQVFLHAWIYVLLAVVQGLSFVGNLAALAERARQALRRPWAWRPPPQRDLFYLLMGLQALMALGLTLWYSWTIDYQPQGRYLFPGLFPILLFLALGLRRVILWVGRERALGSALLALGLALAGLNLYALRWVLLPMYYPQG
ncbi:MAG: hypothetical protein QHJ73_19155, partial [Armatimonadota bacterium]|nr:hypothetical protein [Armatimonadota bacterium]